ncbi:MAG: hypothetical protein J3R72DRAFT_473245 [Linnemannia gamsii]|nr:MAG: hypothetical protein J3R72DRAFT_473245 [Linnemannia gamsii]
MMACDTPPQHRGRNGKSTCRGFVYSNSIPHLNTPPGSPSLRPPSASTNNSPSSTPRNSSRLSYMAPCINPDPSEPMWDTLDPSANRPSSYAAPSSFPIRRTRKRTVTVIAARMTRAATPFALGSTLPLVTRLEMALAWDPTTGSSLASVVATPTLAVALLTRPSSEDMDKDQKEDESMASSNEQQFKPHNAPTTTHLSIEDDEQPIPYAMRTVQGTSLSSASADSSARKPSWLSYAPNPPLPMRNTLDPRSSVDPSLNQDQEIKDKETDTTTQEAAGDGGPIELSVLKSKEVETTAAAAIEGPPSSASSSGLSPSTTNSCLESESWWRKTFGWMNCCRP